MHATTNRWPTKRMAVAISLSCAVCNIVSACNYQNPGSYVNNAVCDFPAIGFDCDGNCLPEYLDENGNCTGVEPCESGVIELSIGTFLGASEIEVTQFQASGTLGYDFRCFELVFPRELLPWRHGLGDCQSRWHCFWRRWVQHQYG